MGKMKVFNVLFAGALLLILSAASVMADTNIAGNWVENSGNNCVITQRGSDYFFSDLNVPNSPGARGRFINSLTIVTNDGWGGGSAYVTNNGNEIRWANGMVWVRSGSTNAGSDNPFSPVFSSNYGNYGTNYGTNYNYTSGTTNISTNLNGSWVQNVDGAPCQIDQQGHSIRFRNLSGGNLRGRGRFNGPDTIVMETDFGGGSAIVTNNGNQINWANGITWSRR